MEKGELRQLKPIRGHLHQNFMVGSQVTLVSLLTHLRTSAHLCLIVQYPVQGVDPLYLSVDWTWVGEVEGNQCLLLHQEEPVHPIAMTEIISAHTAKPPQHLLLKTIWIPCSLYQLATRVPQL
uniref:Uncharacterized protein n=1 Tax=Arundo donax TaxID=35708 RepID=A0A0A8ZNW8_ARUDO